MKNLVLGLLLVATSAIFAQDAPVNFKEIKPVALHKFDLRKVEKHEVARKVAQDKKQGLTTGVVRIVNGHAVIVLLDKKKNNRVYAVNLPKASKVDGRVLQFRMRDSRAMLPAGVKAHKVVILEDLVVIPAK